MSAKQKKQSSHKKNNESGSDLKRLFKVLGLSLLIVFLLAAAVTFISRFTGLDLFSSKDTSSDIPDGVIYQVDSDNVKSIALYESGVVMLTNSAVQYIDSSGREIDTNKHTFASPEMQVNGKTVFVYDKGGSGYRVEKNASVYSEQTASGAITCGAIGKKDNYAFSLDNHEGYQSHIFVYSFRGEKQFEWGSSSDYCFRMALSDSGNKLAVAVIGVENAEYYSKVMVFNFNSGQPAYTVDFAGKTVFDIDFIAGRKIAVYTDSGVYLIDNDGGYQCIQEYSSTEVMQAFVSANGLSCTAIAPYGNEQAPVIAVFDQRHEQLYAHQYDELISGVVSGGSYVGVVLFDRVQILNSDDKVLGDILPGEACERCVIVNHSLFILTGTGLHRYSIYSDTEKAVTMARETTTAAPETTSEPTTVVEEVEPTDDIGPSETEQAEEIEPVSEEEVEPPEEDEEAEQEQEGATEPEEEEPDTLSDEDPEEPLFG